MASKYTLAKNPHAIQFVEGAVEDIVQNIVSYFGEDNCDTIILDGSYGRGEGGVRRSNDGWKLVNDVEMTVIGKEISKDQISVIEKRLTKKYGLDIEIGVCALHEYTNSFEKDFPSTSLYDKRYGSQVIYGDQDIFKNLPEYDPKNIKVWEGLRLLLNRGAGLLMHFTLKRFENRTSLDAKTVQKMKNQVIKAGLAIGDAMIICEGLHNPSYKKKWGIFNELARTNKINLTRKEVAFVQKCYEEKLFAGSYESFNDLYGSYNRLLQIYFPKFLEISSIYFDHKIQSLNAYSDIMNNRKCNQMGAVYATIPLLLESAPFYKQNNLLNNLSSIESILRIKSNKMKLNERWDFARDLCFQKWWGSWH